MQRFLIKFNFLKRNYKLTSEDGQINYSTYDKKEPYEFTVGVGKVVRGYDTGEYFIILTLIN